MISPPPDKYSEPISVVLEADYYSIDQPIYQNSWHTRATAPLPIRSRSSLMGSNLLGGSSGDRKLFLNDRYDPATDTWTMDTDMPAAGEPLCSEKIVVCQQGQASWTAEWENSSFKTKNPCPKAADNANLVKTNQYIMLNGDASVFKFDSSSDCWQVIGENSLFQVNSAAIAAGNDIYTLSNSGLFKTTESYTEAYSDYSFDAGTQAMCAHESHFLASGKNSLRVDLASRSVHVSLQKPIETEYAATNDHFETCGNNNLSLEFRCVYENHVYDKPISISRAGKHTVYSVSLNKKLEPTINEYTYTISSSRIPLAIHISEMETCFVWPACTKITGKPFYFRDLIPEDNTVLIAEEDGPLKIYSHELLDRQPGLNKLLVSGRRYRLKSDTRAYLLIDSHETV